jgi:hypothetical protein
MSEPVTEFRSAEHEAVLSMCPSCGTPKLSREEAATCCVCPGCGAPTQSRYRLYCEGCLAKERHAQVEQLRIKKLALPVVDYDGGPVFVDSIDHFYADLDSAADALRDDGHDLATVIVHPCDTSRVSVPDIHSFVDESWGEQFEEGEWGSLSAEAHSAIEDLLEVLEKERPVIWLPRLSERLMIPEDDFCNCMTFSDPLPDHIEWCNSLK